MEIRELKETWTKEEMADNRRAWIELLRSGELKQGKGRLYNREKDCYCVWGTACKMFGDTFNLRKEVCDIPVSDLVDEDNMEDTKVPPLRVMQAVGLLDDEVDIVAPWSDTQDILYNLWCMNDDGKSFDELADIIEANKFTKSEI